MHSISALILMSYGGICSVGFKTEASAVFHEHTMTNLIMAALDGP